MRRKTCTWLLIGIILVATLIFIVPMIFGGTSMAVMFYDLDGNAVGHPMMVVPMVPVEVAGQQVSSFEITVSWATNNPNALHIVWDIDLKVWNIYGDNPLDPHENVYFDELLWHHAVDKNFWDDEGRAGTGTRTSSRYDIEALCAGIPEGTTFTMTFTGTYAFIDTRLDPYGENPLFVGVFAAQSVQAAMTNYEYIANLDLPW